MASGTKYLSDEQNCFFVSVVMLPIYLNTHLKYIPLSTTIKLVIFKCSIENELPDAKMKFIVGNSFPAQHRAQSTFSLDTSRGR